MKQELSAGGIVYNKQNQWLICQHATYGHWSFPKGHVGDSEQNESVEEAARREVKEETGIDAAILLQLPTSLQYEYERDNTCFSKTVIYFLMKEMGGTFDEKDHEMKAVRWATTEEVIELLTYESDQRAFTEARGLITTETLS